MVRALPAIVVALALASPPAVARASTREVPVDFSTIQAAIDGAADGDVIEVAPGTYSGPGNRDLTFHGLSLTLRAIGGPAATTIDVQGTMADTHRAFDLTDGESASAVVDGFTIENGYENQGGAVELENGASPTFMNCVFDASSATLGGGAIGVEHGSPTFTRCLFTNDTATSGGAIYLADLASVSLTNCAFSGDMATTGGALWAAGGSAQLVNCTFFGNSSRYYGAAVFLRSGAQMTMEQSIIAMNGGNEALTTQLGSTATAYCSDVYGNAGGDWTGGLAGQSTMNGNFSLDPQFCQTPGFELYVHRGSPVIYRGACGMIGAYGQGCPPRYMAPAGLGETAGVDGASSPVTWGQLKTDIER